MNNDSHTFQASANVITENGLRYMKALCNHFDRKANAMYEGTRGSVTFSFGACEMEAHADALAIRATAPSAEHLDRVKHVIADHLVRFGVKETLSVAWVETERANA